MQFICIWATKAKQVHFLKIAGKILKGGMNGGAPYVIKVKKARTIREALEVPG